MRRGTTPTITVKIDFDLTQCQVVWFTLRQRKNVEITKELEQLNMNADGFTVMLSQDETLQFDERGPDVEAQVRALTNTGQAIASDVAYIPIQQILKDGVIG